MSRPSRAGLPSGPGPRSRSAVRGDRSRYEDDPPRRERYEEEPRSRRYEEEPRSRRYDDDNARSPSQSRRQVRPQKSMGSISQSRSGNQAPPPMPSSSSSRSRHMPTASYDARSESSTNRSSDSTTSSGASFMDRMRGYASSRTSLEDEEPPSRSMRNRNKSRAETPPPENDTPGDGFTLWSKVASAASSLTVNVGKAWASNITTFAGEETPVGQESRLTRAMKAYHIEKARDPSDLPAWLFDEKERRRPEPEPSRSRRRNEYEDDDVRREEDRQPPPTRGLRDIYDAAAAQPESNGYERRSARGGGRYADESPAPSKATDRLKALRDAKRGAVNPGALVREEEERARAKEARVEREREPEPRRRVGLPSGPVSRRL